LFGIFFLLHKNVLEEANQDSYYRPVIGFFVHKKTPNLAPRNGGFFISVAQQVPSLTLSVEPSTLKEYHEPFHLSLSASRSIVDAF
jgi:hypothetical protein